MFKKITLMSNSVILFLVFTFLILFANKTYAASYYVDFIGGSDAANGISTSTPWRNIPGTKSAANGTLGGTTGWVAIKAGDIIWLKSGTTHNSSSGGRILIDSGWYANGTPGAPITIKRKTDWGSGQIVIDGTGITTGSWAGLVDVRRQYITIDGVVTSGILIKNSTYANIYQYLSGVGGGIFQNLEVYNSQSAGIRLATADKATPTYVTGNILRNIVAHKTNGGSDTDAVIYVEWQDAFVIDNVIAYDACNRVFQSCDGIHLSSSKNGWVTNSIAYNNGEQGIDLSLDGDNKSRDDAYNITVRDCISYNNPIGNYDSNSGYHNTYFIRNVGWKGPTGTSGNGNFAIYQGTRNKNFYINNTSSGGDDWGYQLTWDSSYSSGYGLPAGSFDQVYINNISSGDAGMSMYMAADWSGHIFNPIFYNNNFYSAKNTTAASVRGTSYSRDAINNKTSGWPGTNDKAVDPLFVDSVGSTFAEVDLHLQPSSPMINAGVFPYTTAASGSGTILNVTPLAVGMDARRVFFAGDVLQIEGSGTYTVISVNSATQITLAGSASWSAGKGVWFPWAGTKPPIGALSLPGTKAITIPPVPPPSGLIPSPPMGVTIQ